MYGISLRSWSFYLVNDIIVGSFSIRTLNMFSCHTKRKSLCIEGNFIYVQKYVDSFYLMSVTVISSEPR